MLQKSSTVLLSEVMLITFVLRTEHVDELLVDCYESKTLISGKIRVGEFRTLYRSSLKKA